MSELTLLIFRLAFLIALWVFVFFVVYAVRSDLFGQRVKKLAAPGRPTEPAKSVFLTAAVPTPASSFTGGLVLGITSGPKAGESVALTSDAVTIGRSSDSSIVIRDDYTSTHHARLEFKNGNWVLSDLGSTNGTFVEGKKITEATKISLAQSFTIGATTFEIRAAS